VKGRAQINFSNYGKICGKLHKARPASKPVAAVGDPPTAETDGNGGEERPPERQSQVRKEAQNRERCPKHLALHGLILAADSVGRAGGVSGLSGALPQQKLGNGLFPIGN